MTSFRSIELYKHCQVESLKRSHSSSVKILAWPASRVDLLKIYMVAGGVHVVCNYLRAHALHCNYKHLDVSSHKDRAGHAVQCLSCACPQPGWRARQTCRTIPLYALPAADVMLIAHLKLAHQLILCVYSSCLAEAPCNLLELSLSKLSLTASLTCPATLPSHIMVGSAEQPCYKGCVLRLKCTLHGLGPTTMDSKSGSGKGSTSSNSNPLRSTLQIDLICSNNLLCTGYFSV